MKSTFLSNVTGSAPAAGTADGNPQNGIPGTQAATKVGAHWFYMITQELLNVLAMGSVTPSATVYDQVRTAITNYVTSAISTALGLSVSFGTNGYFSIAGLWLQWGTHANTVDNETVSFNHVFPNACYGVLVSLINTGDVNTTVNVQAASWGTSNFRLSAYSEERPPNSTGVFWIAVGH